MDPFGGEDKGYVCQGEGDFCNFWGTKSLISFVPKVIAALASQNESAVKNKSEIADTNVIVDLSRQYKTMQTELTTKVKRL